jgi:hypothetical protein
VEDFHLEGLPGDRTDSVGSNLSAGTPKHTTFFDKFVFFLLDRRGGEREGFIEKNVFFFFFSLNTLFFFYHCLYNFLHLTFLSEILHVWETFAWVLYNRVQQV